MIKNLLFFQGIYDTIDLFTVSVMQAFEQLGCNCSVLDVCNQDLMMKQLKDLFEESSIDAVITFNNIGYNLSLNDKENIWDMAEIPYYNILMDHPFHYDYALRHAPETSIVLCTDKNHVNYVRRFYKNISRVDFLPHAGMETDIAAMAKEGDCHLTMHGGALHPRMEDRPIQVLYAGGLSKYVAEGLVPDLGEIQAFDAFSVTQEVLSELMRHPEQTTEDAIESCLCALGKSYSDEELCRYITKLRFIDSYATSFYREQAVRLLVENDIPVTVFGGGWDQCGWTDHPNLIYAGKVLAPQILELMNHSRIVLNTMTWYKNGIHDRIVNGMLAKALVVTDTSEYLQQEVEAQSERVLEYFTLSEIGRLPEQVHGLLQNIRYMEEIAENGYRYAKTHHTWLERAKYILRYDASLENS